MNAPVFGPQEIAGTRRPREQATWLPARAYTDSGVYAREFDSIFAVDWMPVGHQAQIPAVGDYRTLDFGGQPLLLVRRPDGRIQCLINACRHRGMSVAEGSGNATRFHCPYHGWTYDLNGTLVAAPMMQEVVCGQGLPEVRTEVWLGVIFITFNSQAPTLGAGLERVVSDLAPWFRSEQIVLYEEPFSCKWNWKLMWENGIESYHVLGTHSKSLAPAIPAELSYLTFEDGAPFFILHTPFSEPGGPKHRVPATSRIPDIENLPSWTQTETRFYLLWPWLALTTLNNMLILNFIIPDKVDSHVFVWMGIVPAAAKNHECFETFRSHQIAYAKRIQGEDASPCARIQKNFEALQGRYVPGPYNKLEHGIWKFHQKYLNRVQGLTTDT